MGNITNEDKEKEEFDSIVREFTHSAYIPASKKYARRRVHVIVLPEDKKTKN